MATRETKTTKAQETEELKQAQAAEAEAAPEAPEAENKDLANEVETLKGQYSELKALLQQAIAAMSKTAEEKPKQQAEDKNAVLDMTGVSMAEDEGTEWEEYETVRTIRAQKGQEKSVVISVNDRNVQIPLDGRAYRLRKPHAEIFLQSMDADVAAQEFADSVPNEAAPANYEALVKQLADLKARLKDYGVNV